MTVSARLGDCCSTPTARAKCVTPRVPPWVCRRHACAHHDALASPQVRYVSCAAFEVKDGNADLVIHGTTLGSGATRLLAGVFTPRSVQITTSSSRSVRVLTTALCLPTGVFKYNHLVKKLNLSGLGIEAEAASVLAIAVTHNTTLTSIDLSNNPLSDVSVYTGATQHETTGLYALAEAVKVNQSR